MSDETITELIRNLPAILTGLGVILVGYWTYKSKKTSEENAKTLVTVDTQGKSNATALKTVNLKVDGMTSDLVAAKEAAAGAKGELKGLAAGAENGVTTTEEPLGVRLVKGKQPGTPLPAQKKPAAKKSPKDRPK